MTVPRAQIFLFCTLLCLSPEQIGFHIKEVLNRTQ